MTTRHKSEISLPQRGLRSTKGVAYAEFLIAIMPILMLFLGMVQLGLLFGARLMVQHAADRAMRTAIVVLDDDPRYYLGDARNSVRGNQLTTLDLTEAILRLGAQSTGAPATPSAAYSPMSRRATVELAAAMAVFPLAPFTTQDSVREAIERSPWDRAVDYTVSNLRVEYPNANAAGLIQNAQDLVTLQLTYTYTCMVPIIRFVVCSSSGKKEITVTTSLRNHIAGYPYM